MSVAIDVEGSSDVGKVREKNEDQYLIAELEKSSGVLSKNKSEPLITGVSPWCAQPSTAHTASNREVSCIRSPTVNPH